MIGWWILIKQETTSSNDALIIASWETGLFGADWLEKLVHEGTVTQLSCGGYPSSYTATASDVLPLIANEIATARGVEIIDDDDRIHAEITLKHENLDACLPDQALTIEVWDMS